MSPVLGSAPLSPIPVVIADHHEVVRSGICALLKGELDVEVVGEAGNLDDLLLECRRTNAKVILLRHGLSGKSDGELCRVLRGALPDARIIIVVWDNDTSAFRGAVEGGAEGILLGTIDHQKLIQSIRSVAKGDSYLSPDGAARTFRLLRRHLDVFGPRSCLQLLSSQEMRIISFMADGDTNKEIAAKMALSEKTVKNYIANMFAKLEITRRTQAVAMYLQADKPQVQASENEQVQV